MLKVLKSWSYKKILSVQERKCDVKESYFVQQNETKRKRTSEVGIPIELEELIKKYSKIFKNVNREIEFTPLEKCRIKTEEGKIIGKKGSLIPQSREKEAEDYIKSLLKRKSIRYSNSQWRNRIRFIEKPDGDLRLVCTFMRLMIL